MNNKIIEVLNRLVEEIEKREYDSLRKMAYCNEHKFEMEREAIRYAQEAYNRCKLEAYDARDSIVKLINGKE